MYSKMYRGGFESGKERKKRERERGERGRNNIKDSRPSLGKSHVEQRLQISHGGTWKVQSSSDPVLRECVRSCLSSEKKKRFKRAS
jgi:hypothetical protein